MTFTNYSQVLSKLGALLSSFEYALLTPEIDSRPVKTLSIALDSKARADFLQILRKELPFQPVYKKWDKTIVNFPLGEHDFLTLEMYHFFQSERLTYLPIDKVLKSRRLEGGFYLPSWEYLIEFNILNHFLNEEALPEQFALLVDDLHIFLQEGLLDYFNTKYNTSFNSFYDLTDFQPELEEHFRYQLKQFPDNKLGKRLKIGWINARNLLKRSAVF